MDIKDLAKLADICRKKGIKQLKYSEVSGIEIILGDRPQPKARGKSASAKDKIVIEDELSEEDVLFYSASVPN